MRQGSNEGRRHAGQVARLSGHGSGAVNEAIGEGVGDRRFAGMGLPVGDSSGAGGGYRAGAHTVIDDLPQSLRATLSLRAGSPGSCGCARVTPVTVAAPHTGAHVGEALRHTAQPAPEGICYKRTSSRAFTILVNRSSA